MKFENLSLDDFEDNLNSISDLVCKYRNNLNKDPILPNIEYSKLRDKFDENFPNQGLDVNELLAQVDKLIIPNSSKIGHPRFLAWMNNASSDAGILGDIINIGLNQNPFMYKASPAATVLEDIVVKWMGELFGYSGDFGGILVSGGTAANLTSILVARETKGNDPMMNGLNDERKMVLYVSEHGHVTIERAVGILGIGVNNIKKIAVDNQFQMDVTALDKQIEKDIADGLLPFCVVAQGGSPHVGSVDPISKIAEVCNKYELWLHIDAAYGGAAILAKNRKHLFKGIELADSITVDPHKWFYVPTEAGLVLVKNKENLFNTFTKTACKAYKGNNSETNFLDYGTQLSRTARSLKVWFAFRTYGFDKIAACVEQNILLANKLKDRFNNEPGWEVLNPVSLSVVCLRYVPEFIETSEIDEAQTKILYEIEKSGKAFLTPVTVSNKIGIRICFANHRTTMDDVDILYDTITSIAKKL